jgi:hypothetical protein
MGKVNKQIGILAAWGIVMLILTPLLIVGEGEGYIGKWTPLIVLTPLCIVPLYCAATLKKGE